MTKQEMIQDILNAKDKMATKPWNDIFLLIRMGIVQVTGPLEWNFDRTALENKNLTQIKILHLIIQNITK